MKKVIVVLMLFAMGCCAFADEDVWPPAQPKPKRTVQSASDAAPRDDEVDLYTPQPKQKSHMGAQVQLYYDALSNFYQTNMTGALPYPTLWYNSRVGMSGMTALFAMTSGPFEVTTGIDYTFPISIQGAQSLNGSYAVNSQTLNVFGLKALQIGYRVPAAQFTIVPYGGIGVYYGKNTLNFTNYNAGAQADQVVYSKLLATFTAGARIDFNFTKEGNFAGGAGVEVFMPTKLADQLSQSGSFAPGGTSSEISGYGSTFQQNMDFMTSVGGRVYVSLGAYF